MLQKSSILKKKKDFDSVFKKGESFKSRSFILKITKNNLGKSRFGFIVSKKVSKKAVVRNKIKRRLRSIIKQNLKDIKKGMDVVLIILSGIEKKNFTELKEELITAFQKAKIT